MNSSPAALNGEHARNWSRWRTTAIEWLSVIISVFSLLVAFTSMIVSAVIVSHLASKQALTQHKVDNLQQSVDVYRIRAAKMDAWLKAHDVPTEEIYDVDPE